MFFGCGHIMMGFNIEGKIMRYYTKEWYELMQGMHYVSGMTVVPDKEYTDAEIREFYDADLAEEIERDRRIYESREEAMPVDMEPLLEPGVFRPEMFLFEDEETGKLFHVQTPDEARVLLKKIEKEREEYLTNRPPFDPAETIQCFEECYQGVKKYCLNSYPDWARDAIDPRLAALNRMTESIYDCLKALEDSNKAAFDAINAEARAVLDQQNIPEEIHSIFRFHDDEVLALKRHGKDAELYLGYGEELPDGKSPYVRVVFKNISFIDREKGLVFRKKINEHGIWSSNIIYLYDELYRTESGYEVHMLLWTSRGLRYLTIGCEDIQLEKNITLSTL